MLIDEGTGQKWTFEQCKDRIDHLALGLHEKLGIGEPSPERRNEGLES